MFLVVWLICFIIVVTIYKFLANHFVSFLGGDTYFFSIGGRFFACEVLSLILAVVVSIGTGIIS